MKTIDQIVRYTSHCRFSDEDWRLALVYCRENYSGGKVHRSLKPISGSTYSQFLQWMEEGFGSGDVVRYGHALGIISTSTPEYTSLAAYCDFDGNLIFQMMRVPVEKLALPCEEVRADFYKLLYDAGKDFSVRTGLVTELYTPKKFSYVSFFDGKGVGMFSESDDCKHYFVAAIYEKRLYMGYSIDKYCTPLKLATNKEIQALHKATAAKGWTFNARTNQFLKQTKKRREDNVYWYITDRWTVTKDKDSGTAKHQERYEVGNYFLDEMEAVTFAREVVKMRG